MRITSSTVTMSSQTSILEQHTKEETLKIWVGNERQNTGGDMLTVGKYAGMYADALELSEDGKTLLEKNPSIKGTESDKSVIFEIDERDKQKMLIIQKMLEALTGKKIRFYLPKKLEFKKADVPAECRQQAAAVEQRKGWGMEYNYSESHYECEKMSFVSEGIIRTADGREIKFSVQLNMSREFASQMNINIRAGDAKIDPLVINLNGESPGLKEEKFFFDLDCDGETEQISFLTPGNGFLAIDLNNDGIINNGGELFGPTTGNGFDELSWHDIDGNNWIDENDPVFQKLRIWIKDPEGNDRLFALGEKGIGAIYLGNIDTLFNIKDNKNNLHGQVRKTGIFLKEAGSAGVISHIDLVV